MTMAIHNQVSPSEMKTMYMQEGETYATVGKRLDISGSTVCRLVKPLLTDVDIAEKKKENRHDPRGPRLKEIHNDELVLSMRERMMQRDREMGWGLPESLISAGCVLRTTSTS